MRNLKKVLALVLAFSMMLSVVAFANFADVDADADYAGAAELLSALEFMVGDENGNFNPDNTITRAEMAAIVCRIKGLEKTAQSSKGATIFEDVAADHWASGYVNTANNNGFVSGYGDGKFGPNDEVTFEQAVRMIVSALGFDPMAAEKGGWPTGYLVVANTYKITEGVSGSTRADIAVLVANALDTPMMDQTTYGADAAFEILNGKNGKEYRTLLSDMDIYVATGIVTDTDAELAYVTITEDSDDGLFEEDDKAEFEINDSNIGDYQFQSVDVYVKEVRKDYEVVAVVPGVVGETFALVSDDVKKATDKVVEYYVDPANSSKTKEIKIDLTTIVFNKNGVDELDLNDLADVELVFIENTGDTKYDVLVATQYTSEMLEFVDATKEKMTLGGKTVQFDFEDEDKTYVFEDANGNALTLADFAEDDVIAFYSDAEPDNKGLVDITKADYIKVIKLSDAAVEGVIEETYTSNDDVAYIVIDGEEYKVDETDSSVKGLKVGDEGIFYVGKTGKVIFFDGSSVGENYAYVLEAELNDSAFAKDTWQIKLLTKDEGIVIYDTTDDGSEDYEAIFGNKNTTWNETLAAGNLEAKRLITFKTNAKGEIKAIEAAEGKFDTIAAESKYNDRTQIINKKTLEDDVIIFLINENKADNVSVADISYLVDDSVYAGAILTNEDGECVVMVVTEGDSAFDAETGFAIVTKITETKNAEEDDVIKVAYVQNEEEGSVIFDEDSTAKGALDVSDLTLGSVFAFNANAEGVVSNYVVLATIDEDTAAIKVAADINADVVEKLFDDEAELVFGYIENEKRETNSKGELVTVNDETYVVTSASNKYTYNDAGRNTVIETEDYLAEDAYYFDADKNEYTPVLLYVLEGAVIDIYTSTERQELK